MSKVYTTVNTAADKWAVLIQRVNDLVGTLATETVTANGSPNGALTSGNAFVSGIIGSTTLTANTIRGGYPNVSAPLAVGSNLVMNAAFSFVSGAVVANSTVLSVGSSVVNTSTIVVGGNTVINSSAVLSGIVNTTTIMIGNSTVNAYINSTAVLVSNSIAHSLLTPASIFLGNTVTNTTITSAGIAPGGIQSIAFGDVTANLTANALMLKVANTMSSATLEPTRLTVGSSLVNATAIAVGANVVLSTTFISVGNTIANSTFIRMANGSASANLTPDALTIGIASLSSNAFTIGTTGIANGTIILGTATFLSNSGVSVGSATFSNSGVSVGNSTVNTAFTATSFATGNAATNASMNSTTLSITKIIFADGTVQNSGSFVIGTKLVFPQATVPPGWSLDTNNNDMALRIVNTTGGTKGGNSNFSYVFANRTTDYHTLTVDEMPAHMHYPGTLNYFVASGGEGGYFETGPYHIYYGSTYIGYTNWVGGGGSHTHGLIMDCKYLDSIIGVKV